LDNVQRFPENTEIFACIDGTITMYNRIAVVVIDSDCTFLEISLGNSFDKLVKNLGIDAYDFPVV
jgi:hypothetical protein